MSGNLVCRWCARAGQPSIRRRISVLQRREDMTDLLEAAQNPVFRQYITTLKKDPSSTKRVESRSGCCHRRLALYCFQNGFFRNEESRDIPYELLELLLYDNDAALQTYRAILLRHYELLNKIRLAVTDNLWEESEDIGAHGQTKRLVCPWRRVTRHS